MFNLMRYYSIASLAGIVVAATLLGMFYRQLSEASLLQMAGTHNAALTRVFGNALWPHFAPLLANQGSLPPDHPEIAALRQAVVGLMRETAVVKIKVYNLRGVKVFSTEDKQIGENKHTNPGFLAAAQGQLASELTLRNQFSAFHGVIESREIGRAHV